MKGNEIKNFSLPLIERILVIGVNPEELSKIFKQKKISSEEVTNMKINILEEYKSNELREAPNENYIENIPIFCMPEGLKISEDSNNLKTYTHSFSLITNSAKRKHCSCLTFYENYESKTNKISLLKAICIVSNQAIYSTHLDILNNIYSIISNYKINKTMFPEQLKYVYLKDKSKSYTVIKEYTILEFYFSFILNSLKCDKQERSYFVNYIGNNTGKKCFLKYHTNDNFGFPLRDFDMTILLDKFNIEDLIKIYLSLLMEYKLILIFDDYQDINSLIFSIINLLFPLKWNFPLISFITPTLMETLEAPFGIIIGVHSKFMNIVTSKLNQSDVFTEETLIYNLSNKSFIYLPNKFPELPIKILNELRSNIYLVLSEKLSLTSEIDNEDTDLYKLFPSIEICKKIDPVPFLNLKLTQVFFNVFLELIKNLDSSIYFNKVKSIKNSKEKFQLSDIFDDTKFINDRDFHNDKQYFSFVSQFSKTLMFMQFLEKYIKHSEKKPKYKFIKKLVTVLNTKENGKSIVKELIREYIKNKMISYYNFNFISLEDALKQYIDKIGSLSSTKNYDDRLIWNNLENYKIINFEENCQKYMFNVNDDRIKDNYYRKLYLDLMKYKEFKQYEVDGDEGINSRSINVHETKMKAFLEDNYYSNKITGKSINNFDLKSSNTNNSINTSNSISNKHTSFNLEIPNKTNANQSASNIPYNTIIKCDNNIENYYFNNINISTDELNNRLNTNLNIDSSNTKLKTNNAVNSINPINSINSFKSMRSNNNSINSSINSSNLKSKTSIFNDNLTSRNANKNNSEVELIRKSVIANLKHSNEQISKEKERERINFLDKLDKKRNSKIQDFSKLINFTNRQSSRNNLSNKNSLNDNNTTNSNHEIHNFNNMMNVPVSKKFRFANNKDPNFSLHISPMKKVDVLDISTQSIQSNKSKIKNLENLLKLEGDKENDIFSGDEDDFGDKSDI